MLLFGTVHKKEVCVSVFLGTHSQRVLGVCAKEKEFESMGRTKSIHMGGFNSRKEKKSVLRHNAFLPSEMECPQDGNY